MGIKYGFPRRCYRARLFSWSVDDAGELGASLNNEPASIEKLG